MDKTYYQALSFCQTKSREEGIDGALANGGRPVDALLVPSDVGQTYQVAAQAGYPMVTVPAGVSPETGMPFGLGIMGTAWSEGLLVKWASAIEDAVAKGGRAKGLGRTLPRWYGYLQRNVPVLNL
jgi:amidase